MLLLAERPQELELTMLAFSFFWGPERRLESLPWVLWRKQKNVYEKMPLRKMIHNTGGMLGTNT